MGQVSFKPPTLVHTIKTVTTRQQSPGGVPWICGQILSMIGKVVFAKPAHINAIWLSLAVTITCYRSHERLCRLTFVFHISKAQQRVLLSFSPKHRRPSSLLDAVVRTLLMCINGQLRSVTKRPPVLPQKKKKDCC